MKAVLNKDVKKLGYRGDVVNVKNGYFRNFLYPNGYAVAATPSLLKLAESRKEQVVMKKQQLLDNAKDVLKKLKGLKVIIKGKTSGKGKLYGAIAEVEVIEAIKEASKVELEKEYIKMEHLKELGEHEVLVHLGDKLEEKVIVSIEAAE